MSSKMIGADELTQWLKTARTGARLIYCVGELDVLCGIDREDSPLTAEQIAARKLRNAVQCAAGLSPLPIRQPGTDDDIMSRGHEIPGYFEAGALRQVDLVQRRVAERQREYIAIRRENCRPKPKRCRM